ncbi:MAG: hypothetical protein HY681_13765, partial [Chloroflexi bacterium]|nr:hypothetical protein [Chloroflexota bacterium]
MTRMQVTEEDDRPLYKQVVTWAPVGLVLADRDGIVRLWNRGAEAI